MDLLFVYGTLRPAPGHPMHAVLARGAVHVGTGRLRGRLYDLGAFPGLRTGAGGWVTGDVYALTDPDLLPRLDRYEGYHREAPGESLYLRERRAVHTADGRAVEAWVYVYAGPVEAARRIASGDWLAHVGA